MENNSFTGAIEISFNKAYDHYKAQVVNAVLNNGGQDPFVAVLELNTEDLGDQQAVGISGKSYTPDNGIQMRDFIKALAEKYARQLVKGNGKDLPSSIICVSEAFMGRKIDKDGTYKPLQDGKGNPLNGAEERLIIGGMSVTHKKRFDCFEIVRNNEGKIVDLVIDNEIGDEGIEYPMLNSFYATIGDVLDETGKFDQFRNEK